MKTKLFLIGIVLSMTLIAAACAPALVATQPAQTIEQATATTEILPSATVMEPATSEPPILEPTVPPTEVSPTATNEVSGPALDGKALLETACTACHSLGRVEAAHKDLNGWTATVNRMVGKGANLTPEQASAVALYLSQTYP